jgi:hypothetical protein
MGMIVDTGANTITGFRNGFMLTGAAVAAVAVLAAFLIDPEADRARFAAADLASDHVGGGGGRLVTVISEPSFVDQPSAPARTF